MSQGRKIAIPLISVIPILRVVSRYSHDGPGSLVDPLHQRIVAAADEERARGIESYLVGVPAGGFEGGAAITLKHCASIEGVREDGAHRILLCRVPAGAESANHAPDYVVVRVGDIEVFLGVNRNTKGSIQFG